MAEVVSTQWIQEMQEDDKAAVGLRVKYDDQSEFIMTAVFSPDENAPMPPTAARVFTALVNDLPMASVLGRYDALREIEDVLPEIAYPVLGSYYHFVDGSTLKTDIVINFVPPDTVYISESVDEGLSDLVDLSEYCWSTGGGMEVQDVRDIITEAFSPDDDDEGDDEDEEGDEDKEADDEDESAEGDPEDG
jgi:hypothetical protein